MAKQTRKTEHDETPATTSTRHPYEGANGEPDPTNLFHVCKVHDPVHGDCVFVKSHNLLITADDARSYATWLNRIADTISPSSKTAGHARD